MMINNFNLVFSNLLLFSKLIFLSFLQPQTKLFQHFLVFKGFLNQYDYNLLVKYV
jgi:hypothetical protein